MICRVASRRAHGALVVRDFPDDEPGPEQWQFTPARRTPGARDGPAYVIRDAISGKVLGNPAAADCGVRQWDAAAGGAR